MNSASRDHTHPDGVEKTVLTEKHSVKDCWIFCLMFVTLLQERNVQEGNVLSVHCEESSDWVFQKALVCRCAAYKPVVKTYVGAGCGQAGCGQW